MAMLASQAITTPVRWRCHSAVCYFVQELVIVHNKRNMATINSMVPHQLDITDIPPSFQKQGDTPIGNMNSKFYTEFLCDKGKV